MAGQNVEKMVFEREREAKNTVRFQEKERPGKPTVIGSLYVQKFFAGDPQVLDFTIEKEDR